MTPGSSQRPQERPAALDATRGPETTPKAVTGELSAPREASEADANPAPRPWTPDSRHDDGSTTLVLKRCCNGCGTQLGDVIARDVDEHGNLTDVRGECDFCAPVVEWERAGCRAWNLTPRNIARVDHEVDRDGIYAKGFWETVGGELQVTGLRIGRGETRIVAKYGDWIIRHPNGTWAVHYAPATTSEGAPA